jgi:hypothetical protein
MDLPLGLARLSSEVRVDKRSVGAKRIPVRKRGGETLARLADSRTVWDHSSHGASDRHWK